MENLTKKQKIILGILIGGMIITIAYYFMQENEQTEYVNFEEKVITEKSEANLEVKTIMVHIAGCVVNEGVVVLNEGDRIADAIEKADGLTSDANIKDVNLAYPLKDGQKVYIPSNIEEESTYVTTQSGQEGSDIEKSNHDEQNDSGLININTATQTELETLPGIGPSTALKILEYRKKNGKFNQIEDLKNVSGIGDAKYEAVQDQITV